MDIQNIIDQIIDAIMGMLDEDQQVKFQEIVDKIGSLFG